MYHGGVVHPPKPRDFSIGLNKKVRKFAMRSALAAKYKEGKLVILDAAAIDKPKTKVVVEKVKKLGWNKDALIVAGEQVDQNLDKASLNFHRISVIPQKAINVRIIIQHDMLALTKNALPYLEKYLPT